LFFMRQYIGYITVHPEFLGNGSRHAFIITC
jgi:hypothetical protein